VKYFVKVDSETHEVELTERFGRLHVRLDGESVDARYEEVDRLGQVALHLGTESHALSIEGDEQSATVSYAGHAYRVELEDEREQAAHAAESRRGGRGGDVKAVMPGVVVELLVAVGERVERGQPLLLLEAMKMQNEIAAPMDGCVKALHVSQGQAVPSGARLATLEPAAEECS